MMKKISVNEQGRSMIEMLGVLAVIGVLTVGGFSLISKVSTTQKTNTLIDEIGVFSNKTHVLFREFVLDQKAAAAASSGSSALEEKPSIFEEAPKNPGMSKPLSAEAMDLDFGKGGKVIDLGSEKDTGLGGGFSSLGSDSANALGDYLKTEHAYPETWEYEDGAFITKDDVKIKATWQQLSSSTTSSATTDYFDIQITQLDEDMCMALAQATWGSPSINGYIGICAGAECTAEDIKSCESTATNCKKGGGKLSLDGAATACSGNGTSNSITLLFR